MKIDWMETMFTNWNLRSHVSASFTPPFITRNSDVICEAAAVHTDFLKLPPSPALNNFLARNSRRMTILSSVQWAAFLWVLGSWLPPEKRGSTTDPWECKEHSDKELDRDMMGAQYVASIMRLYIDICSRELEGQGSGWYWVVIIRVMCSRHMTQK